MSEQEPPTTLEQIAVEKLLAPAKVDIQTIGVQLLRVQLLEARAALKAGTEEREKLRKQFDRASQEREDFRSACIHLNERVHGLEKASYVNEVVAVVAGLLIALATKYMDLHRAVFGSVLVLAVILVFSTVLIKKGMRARKTDGDKIADRALAESVPSRRGQADAGADTTETENA